MVPGRLSVNDLVGQVQHLKIYHNSSRASIRFEVSNTANLLAFDHCQ